MASRSSVPWRFPDTHTKMSADLSRERLRAATRLAARLRERFAACDRYDMAVAVLFAVLAVLVPVTFHAYAITNDEEVQQRYGEMIVAYYASGFKNQSLFHFVNLYLYGGLFDGLAVMIQHALPMVEPYAIRHLLCAVIGLGGIAAAWATARMVAGPRAAAIAAFSLAVCGPWYGSMFNHTKDIPFAAAMMAAAYFLLRATRDLPRPRWRHVIAFGIFFGAALGIRVLGLLLAGYVALAIFVSGPSWRANLSQAIEFYARSVTALLPAFVIAYLIMIVAWPWSALSPLNPIRGLFDFGEFHYQIRTLLGGHIYEMANVPRWYVPAYLLFKLPLIIVAGAIVSIVFILWPRSEMSGHSRRRNDTLLLAVIAAFPVLCEVSFDVLSQLGPRPHHRLGAQTCGDLRDWNMDKLQQHFGSFGARLYDLCRGIDYRDVNPVRERKSISTEETYTPDVPDLEGCLALLPDLYEHLLGRIKRNNAEKFINKLFVKIKFADFQRTTVECVGYAPNMATYRHLMETGWLRASRPVRLLGVGVRLSDTETVEQLSLFDERATH